MLDSKFQAKEQLTGATVQIPLLTVASFFLRPALTTLSMLTNCQNGSLPNACTALSSLQGHWKTLGYQILDLDY